MRIITRWVLSFYYKITDNKTVKWGQNKCSVSQGLNIQGQNPRCELRQIDGGLKIRLSLMFDLWMRVHFSSDTGIEKFRCGHWLNTGWTSQRVSRLEAARLSTRKKAEKSFVKQAGHRLPTFLSVSFSAVNNTEEKTCRATWALSVVLSQRDHSP